VSFSPALIEATQYPGSFGIFKIPVTIMWTLIVALILIGLLLVILEIVFVPGTTIVGLAGVVLAGVGILFAYREFGNETGWYVLLGTAGLTAVALFFSFRSKAWLRFANKSAIAARVNEDIAITVSIGDEGVAVTTLKPYGRAEFNGQTYEVKSLGDYVNVGSRVQVIQIQGTQIIVKPLN